MSSILDTIKEKLVVNEMQSIASSSGISDIGAYDIRNKVYSQFGLYVPYIGDDENFWEWKNNSGTFTKRLSNWLYKEHGVKITPELLSSIGNIYSQNSNSKGSETWFDFTDRIQWNPGDFGDEGSCFWGCRTGARKVLEDNDVLAIRFYEYVEDANGKLDGKMIGYDGYARAFISTINNLDCIVVWNGYGLSTLNIARTLSTYLGLSYKKIELLNNEMWNGLVYINGEGIGYAISDESTLNNIHSIDLGYECPKTCCSCEEVIERGEETHVLPLESHYYVCNRCLDEYYTTCDVCNNVDGQNSSHTIDGTTYCRYCFDKEYRECTSCRVVIPKNETDKYVRPNGYTYCNSCHDRIFTPCLKCGNSVVKNEQYADKKTGEKMCYTCFMVDHSECVACYTYMRKEDLIFVKYNGYYYCEKCLRRKADNGTHWAVREVEKIDAKKEVEEKVEEPTEVVDDRVPAINIQWSGDLLTGTVDRIYNLNNAVRDLDALTANMRRYGRVFDDYIIDTTRD